MKFFMNRIKIIWPMLLGIIGFMWITGTTLALIPQLVERQEPHIVLIYVWGGVILGFSAMYYGLQGRMKREPETNTDEK